MNFRLLAAGCLDQATTAAGRQRTGTPCGTQDPGNSLLILQAF